MNNEVDSLKKRLLSCYGKVNLASAAKMCKCSYGYAYSIWSMANLEVRSNKYPGMWS